MSQTTAQTESAPAAGKNKALLTTDRLVKTYRQRRVVNGVSITVGAGEIVGLLGPNGAGKTTTFNMVVGVVRPDEGVGAVSRTATSRRCPCTSARGWASVI